MNKNVVCFLCFFCAICNFKAQTTTILDEIFITSTKFEETKENIANVVFTITNDFIEKNQHKTVIELLNALAGIEVRGANTNITEPRSLYVRGGRSRQILILIDGVPVSDASLINQEFDLRFLNTQQIEKIEILKGGASTLYGSGAATGVINIILKKQKKDAISGSYQASIGTNKDAFLDGNLLNQKSQGLHLQSNFGNLNITANYNLTGTNGMSAAKSTSNTTFETDAYFAENASISALYKFTNTFSVQSFLNYDAFATHYDAGNFTDSDINNGNQNQLRIGLKPSYSYKNGEFYVLASLQKVKRFDANFSGFTNSINHSTFEGETLFVDVVHKYQFSKKLDVISGFNYQKHSNNSVTPFGNISKTTANFYTADPYLLLNFKSEYGYAVTLGSRLNMHSTYGNHLVYNAAIAKTHAFNSQTSLKGIMNYSTAFVAPSTYQLFSDFGNTNLQPETNNTFETGFTLVHKNHDLSFTYFHRNEQNAIIFQSLNIAPFGQYRNGAASIFVDGVEVQSQIRLSKSVNLTSNYTYISKNEDVDYIPSHKLNSQLSANITNDISLILTHTFVGERSASFFDTNTFTTQKTTLEKYNLFDFSATYQASNTVSFSAAITNVMNTDFQDILGYSTRGRNYNFGVRLTF